HSIYEPQKILTARHQVQLRFFDICYCAFILQLVRVALGKAAHNNDWDAGRRWVMLEESQYKLASHLRQQHVQDYEVRAAITGQPQGFLSITNIDHAEASFNENLLDCGPYEPTVFNYKNCRHDETTIYPSCSRLVLAANILLRNPNKFLMRQIGHRIFLFALHRRNAFGAPR